MHVGHHAYADGPRVRREGEMMLLRHGRDPSQSRDTATPRDIRLQHVETAPPDELLELVHLQRTLATGDTQVGAGAQRGHPLDVAAVQRLLQPVHVEFLELPCHAQSILQLPRGLRVPRHLPSPVAVDHQHQAITDALADGLHHGHVVPPVRTPEAQLHRRETAPQAVLGEICHLLRITQRAGRRVHGAAVGQTPEQLPDGLPSDLAGQIPQRDVQRPGAPVVEVEVRERVVVALEQSGSCPTSSCRCPSTARIE
jgi:hypothetical protein